MFRPIAALLAVASCASLAHAQTSPPAISITRTQPTNDAPVLTLDRALALGEANSPGIDAANSGVRVADATRTVAGLRPNPTASVNSENIAGTGPYRGFAQSETTVGLSVPIELGGKRSARIGVADALGVRAKLDVIVARADLRLSITQAYIRALSAERRASIAEEQLGFATEGLRIARDRVQVGATSPLDEQRAAVTEVNARTALDTARREALAARAALGLLIGEPVDQPLDMAWFDQLGPQGAYGPTATIEVDGTLALAVANADLNTAKAGVRLAQSQRIPDLTVSAGVRRLQGTGDSAAVVGVSIPLPFFNNGRAQLGQAKAVRDQADARRRVAILEARTAISNAQADVSNAEARARASGPAIAAAAEAARIARIGYGQGKFEQIVLIDAERTLAETRAAAVDAFAAYHDALARLARLTAAAPTSGDTQ